MGSGKEKERDASQKREKERALHFCGGVKGGTFDDKRQRADS